MVERLLQIIAPHYCYGCAKVGSILCANCKYDIADESNDVCIVCLVPTSVGVCISCRKSYSRAWFVGERHDVLRQVIDGFKFERVKSASRELADLLDSRLPSLPPQCVLVPVPTVTSHIRQRGYDHTLLIARHLGKARGLLVKQLLSRHHSEVQRGKSKQERFAHMSTAFGCKDTLDSAKVYIVIDDVVTTGATLRYAAEALVRAGAGDVWVAAVARQPLDK